jgi:tetratricopeptide (TPR) repeat protein
MKLKPALRHLVLLAVTATAAPLGAQVYSLTENTWSNPEFVKRFTGSYGFDTNVTPSITSEEKTAFEKLAPVIGTNPTQAIADLKAGLKPDSSPALVYTLANLYFQTGQLKEAETHYLDAIRKFPNFLRAYKNLAIVYIQESRFADAVPPFLKTIQLGGQGGDVYGMLGYAYLNSSNSVAALRAYEQALFFEPHSRDWRMGRVQCLMNLNRYDDAIGVIDDLVEQFPNQKDLLLLQANAYIAKSRPEDAAATLEVLRSSGGANNNALALLGDIYLNLQQADLALGVYEEALEGRDLSPDRALRIARRLAAVSAWSQLDQYLASLEQKQLAAAQGALEFELLSLRAQSDLAQDRIDAAAGKLARVVDHDPLNGRALLLLADYHWRKDEIERAELYFERAARVEAFTAEALTQHARMFVGLRDFRRAVPLLERAQTLKLQPHIAQYLERVSAAARTAAR